MIENNMQQSNEKLGSYLSILTGIALLIFGISYLLLPEDQTGPASEAFNSLADDSFMFKLSNSAFGLSAVFAIGALLALSDLVNDENKSLVRYVNVMGIIGYASVMIVSFTSLARTPLLAKAYVKIDDGGQSVINAYGGVSIDPWFLVQFGLVGLWLFSLNWLTFKGDQLPKNLSIIGMALGFAYWIASISFIIESISLRLIAAGIGGAILAPIYFIWLGIKFRDMVK